MRSGTLARAQRTFRTSPGADNIRHTADDQPVHRGMVVPNTAQTLTDFPSAPPPTGRLLHQTAACRSMIRCANRRTPSPSSGFAHGETLHVPVDHVLRELVYDKDDVAIKEEVWMPLMGGLY